MRLVEAQREGKFVFYRIADESVERVWVSLRGLAEERLTEVKALTQDYFQARESLDPADRKTLLNLARRGEVILLDVRPEDEFQAGHLPGARSIPLAELKSRTTELK